MYFYSYLVCCGKLQDKESGKSLSGNPASKMFNRTVMIYYYTYGEKFDPDKSSFYDYFKENFNKEKVLYKEIKTIEIDKDIVIDLALTSNKQSFVESDIRNISLLEELEFPVGDRIYLLENPSEYFIYKNKPLCKVIVYTENMENCRILLLSESTTTDMLKLKNKIELEIENLDRDKSSHLNENLNIYFTDLKNKF